MAAIGTKAIRKILVEQLIDDVNSISSGNKYFIGVGKSDQYNITDTLIAPTNTIEEQRIARANLQSVKRVADCTTVVSRYNWSAGAIYSAWTDDVVNLNPARPFYVVTEDNDVYVCIQQGKDESGNITTSTVKPSYTNAGVTQDDPFETNDGYRWKYLYSISSVRSFAFQSANWIPIQEIQWEEPGDSANLNTTELQQLSVQRSATPGQILGVNVDNGGSGYTSPVITFKGNGTGANATATIVGGAIVKVEMNNESAAMGSGYDYASISIQDPSGTGANLKPIIGPVNGLGANPLDDLNCTSAMFTVKPDGDESETFITTNDFRQISLWKNLEQIDSDALLVDNTAKALKFMTMKNAPTATDFTVDRLIRGASSNAAAYIDDFDSANIYYHQNEKTGFALFAPGEIVSESDGEGSGIIDSSSGSALQFGSVDAFSGECLYLENRSAVVRSGQQQEDIKIIITV